MSNMSYCRFRNTLADLKDCLEHLEDTLTDEESDAREELVYVCKQIVRTHTEE